MLPVPVQPLPRWIVLPACAVAVLGVASIWAAVVQVFGRPAPWLAALVALDVLLILHLAGWRRAPGHPLLAIAVTGLTVMAAQGMIAAARIGNAMGLPLAESLPRMSLELAWLHARSNAHWSDAAWYGVALVLAWWFASPRRSA